MDRIPALLMRILLEPTFLYPQIMRISELVQENLNLGSSTDKDDHGLSHQKILLMAFLKQLVATKGELYSFSCPAFLMSGTSLLEYVAHWMDFPNLFAQIRFANDPQGK